MPVTPLPTPPSRSTQSGDTFVALADAFLGALPAFGAELNALELGSYHWAPNFVADAVVYIPAILAMTIDQGNAEIGTGTIAYAKSTTAAPSTFNSTTLPATLEAGAWLQVTVTGVSGFKATHLRRTA